MKSLDKQQRAHLRDLAARVADIAQTPEQAERRELWKRHNGLENVRPMVLCFPEGAWRELLPHDSMTLEDPFWSEIEWHLRHILYHFEHHHDDLTLEPVFRLPIQVTHTGWGMKSRRLGSDDPSRAWKWDPALKNPKELSKLHYPTIIYDEDDTNRKLANVRDVFGDRLEVERSGANWWNPVSVVGILAELRGLGQLMLDLCDRPEWVHEAMSLLSEGVRRLMCELESRNLLTLTNRDHYVGSGGLGYSDELPAPGFDGTHVRLCDTWGFAEAQEVSEVSPRMHEEFCLQYQIPLLEAFGLNCYNCCEDITHKFKTIKKIPRLRRVSVSPWTDRRVAAEELGDDFIYSWKPNPVMVAADYDPDLIRQVTRETLEITRGCVVEMILKDTHTINNHPERLTVWTDICREEIARVQGD